jgi:hypothetical protein
MTRAPQARLDDLIVQEMDGELVVYDLEQHRAHCLNGVAATVFRLCDGLKTPAEMAVRLDADEDVVWLALEQLWKLHLLEGDEPREDGLSRRALLKRTGLLTAALALPATASVLAPRAAAAATCLPNGASIECTPESRFQCCSQGCQIQTSKCCDFEGGPCSTDDECCSGNCLNTGHCEPVD